MPCRDYEDDYRTVNDSREKAELRKQNDRLARIACKAMTALEEAGQEDFLLLKDEEVREWWAKHKEADAKAKAEREEKARIARIKKEALAKLSTEERKALGIKVK
jgi:hypothetical protein